ncbi:proline dehydrogenase [Prolixibacteraceae bacterium JC049]|nr:proline dehydrogenase [Prolixibacteraceae bacterium JC049]
MLHKMIAGVIPHMPKKLIWMFSKAYIAGETVEDAIKASAKLNEEGVMVTIDILGEFITDLSQATESKEQYLDTIKRFTDKGVDGNFSVKPTSFGLLLDPEVCYQNIREVVKLAAEKGNFIRIDMEDSQCVDMEWDIYKRLKAEFPGHVGLVLQAYLHRTMPDLVSLNGSGTAENPYNFRLCKGIYVEPEEIAYKGYQEVRNHFVENLEYMLTHDMYVGIATHDKYLIEKAFELIEKHNVPRDKYEFQMLYGVTPELRKSVVNAGHRMRVYVPFGKDWFGYSTRRLKENPKMVNHIVKALFVKG